MTENGINWQDIAAMLGTIIGVLGGLLGCLAIGLTWGNKMVSRSEFTTRLDNFEKAIDAKIEDMEKRIETRISSFETSIEDKINLFYYQLSRRIEGDDGDN